MVVVVVVVLAGFEAFKELANFSRTGFQFVSHPPSRQYSEKFPSELNRHTKHSLLPPLGPQTEFGNKSDFSHFPKLCRIGVIYNKRLVGQQLTCRGEYYSAIRTTFMMFVRVRVRLYQVTANTYLGSKSDLLTSTLSSIGKIASPQFSV